MNKRLKSGFTLVELVVSLAIMLIIFAGVFSVIGSFYRVKKAYDQEAVLQQNFRFALDTLSNEFRRANKKTDGTDDGDIILKPQNNTMDEELIFKSFIDEEWKVIKYHIVQVGDRYVLYRSIYDYAETYEGLSEAKSSQPLTEEMSQLVKIYFAREGRKIAVIIVGKLDYLGKENLISYTTLIFSRNSPYQVIK
jgi:prepilin-type N-terminal cleavage/methylation domain-containing protein